MALRRMYSCHVLPITVITILTSTGLSLLQTAPGEQGPSSLRQRGMHRAQTMFPPPWASATSSP